MLEHMHRNFKLCAKHLDASHTEKYARIVALFKSSRSSRLNVCHGVSWTVHTAASSRLWNLYFYRLALYNNAVEMLDVYIIPIYWRYYDSEYFI